MAPHRVLLAAADSGLAMRLTLVHAIARGGLALIFAYQGLVPKLIAGHPDEVAMLRNAGVAPEITGSALTALGVAELLLAAGLLVFWRRREPAAICLGLMLVATLAVVVSSPRYLVAAFNPATLNLAVACLAAIDYSILGERPSEGARL